MAGAGKATLPTRHVVLYPDGGSFWDLFKHVVFRDIESGAKFLGSSDDKIPATAVYYRRWTVSVFLCKVLMLLETPLEIVGHFIEFCLNFYHQNDGFLGILLNTLFLNLKIPRRGTGNFISAVGYMDRRVDLQGTPHLSQQADQEILKNGSDFNVKQSLGNVSLMDLCIMSAKLAYENTQVVNTVVSHHWKMNFEADYQGMNQLTGKKDTHAFIFCDKPKDANLIVISFRGTGPFSMRNWCSDFDFSLVEFGDAGCIHVGFLEAMGLGHRYVDPSFGSVLKLKPKSQSGLSDKSDTGPTEFVWGHDGAFYLLASKLKDLLNQHKNAKFAVTGHSLGGALAIVFVCILEIQQQTDVLERLLNVYTFGQPRIGNYDLGYFMMHRLNFPERKYFRVVYSNDIVPRVPFDDPFFTFEHFGTCIYYNSYYFGYFTKEEPGRNFFGLGEFIRMHNTAWVELLRSLVMGYIYGPEYNETWECTTMRVVGLLLPGVAAHCPVNYVNSVRLGREIKVPFLSLKSVARGYWQGA